MLKTWPLVLLSALRCCVSMAPGMRCCDTVRVNSQARGNSYQSLKMGIYHSMNGKINNRKVYKHAERDEYIYYWVWHRNGGENWMVSNNFRLSAHGIESDNMQDNEMGYCVSDVNRSGLPFKVYADNRWRKDTFLRIECHSEAACCQRVNVTSVGYVAQYQPNALGSYTAFALRNGRWAYRQNQGNHFIYLWDWGPNSGNNWMISTDPLQAQRGIESANVEYNNATFCVHDVKETVGPFRVYVSQNRYTQSWLLDSSMEIHCVD